MKLAVLLLALLPAQKQGLKDVAELAQAGKKDEALALCNQLSGSGTARQRAAVEYARGVVHAAAGERPSAAESFQHARADGSGELRLASIYNLGSLALEQGEEWFKKLPEVSGKPPPAPAAPQGQPQGQPPGPDPLVQARQSYLAARQSFLERLKAQWDDADTRADVELVQRRLKRLDEIEKQRKEEEQKKQQQKQQDSKNDKDPKDKPDPKDQQDPKDKQDPNQPPPDPKDQEKKDPQKPEPPKPEDQKQPGDEQQPQPKPEPEKQISKEEMTRLLDKLQKLEEQAAKLRAQIHQARRVAVKKDW